MPTIIDVAKAAGVSRSTASRALSGHPSVDDGTRARVVQSAKDVGYRVNRLASGLRSGRSYLLGLAVTNLVNASIQEITQVVQRHAREAGYKVLLGVTNGDPLVEAGVIEAFAESRVDGLILMGSVENAELINQTIDSGTPIVGMIRNPSGLHLPVVLPDNVGATRAATRHLLGLGHRRIAYIGGALELASGMERFQGFSDEMAAAGAPIDTGLVLSGPFTPEFGVSAAATLLEHREQFTALLVANHEAIFGVLPELVHAGVSVPDELSLICVEDVSWFSAWRPPITVIDIDPDGIGETAFDVLMREISEPGVAVQPPVRREARLIERGSCGPVRGAPS
ncbi:LacI family DNA-binding transcriptional regulator [Microbacterium sp. 2MCAF23]|uniref:LacI family DNA-binding transcriptional regulator n=1 Tax=Microbacterium sp. 2MCAF23 TaxID=3232985 RepID=UPI003F9A8143